MTIIAVISLLLMVAVHYERSREIDSLKEQIRRLKSQLFDLELKKYKEKVSKEVKCRKK